MRQTSRHLSELDGCLADVGALAGLAHRCEPALCRESGSCCAAHDVWLGDEERARILDLWPAVVRYATHLAEGAGTAGAFRRLGPDAWAVRRRGDGLCAFAYDGAEGETLCAVHGAALETSVAPEAAKPRGCVLWPLALSSARPPVLGVQAGALRYPCNSTRPPDAAGLDEGVARIVAAACGGAFLRKLRRALRDDQQAS